MGWALRRTRRVRQPRSATAENDGSAWWAPSHSGSFALPGELFAQHAGVFLRGDGCLVRLRRARAGGGDIRVGMRLLGEPERGFVVFRRHHLIGFRDLVLRRAEVGRRELGRACAHRVGHGSLGERELFGRRRNACASRDGGGNGDRAEILGNVFHLLPSIEQIAHEGIIGMAAARSVRYRAQQIGTRGTLFLAAPCPWRRPPPYQRSTGEPPCSTRPAFIPRLTPSTTCSAACPYGCPLTSAANPARPSSSWT